MPVDIRNINTLWTSLMVEELVRQGVTYFCISPGSRSTPLAISAANNSAVKTMVHFDERGAAFHALGYARATQRPAVLISTSGTAGANYYPAIIEAAMDGLPMIVMTADRPPELQYTGANQTIEQTHLFGQYVRWDVTISPPDTAQSPQSLLTLVDEAVYLCQRSPGGPVHLNCQFREPLEPVYTEDDFSEYLAPIHHWIDSSLPYTQKFPGTIRADAQTVRDIGGKLERTMQGLIIVGRLTSDPDREAVLSLADHLHWPVFPDILSGLRLGFQAKENFIFNYDQLLLSNNLPQFDLVLHLGGKITSKRLLTFLEKNRSLHYIHVKNHPYRSDPHHCVTDDVDTDIAWFCHHLQQNVPAFTRPDIVAHLRRWATTIEKATQSYLESTTLINEIMVSRLISLKVSPDLALFLGSSMPIRDMDMFACAEGRPTRIAANRGASGIDGTIASATGLAVGMNIPVIALVGDLAALHDLNSLALVRAINQPVILIVINNNGGGIFNLLPIANYSRDFEKFFGTPHGLTFKLVARMFHLDYFHPETQDALEFALDLAIKNKKSILIEVNTDRQNNARLHQSLQQAIQSALAENDTIAPDDETLF